MRVGTVIGTVTATARNPRLSTHTLLIVDLEDADRERINGSVVALDTVGAGVGQTVLVATGSAARMPEQLQGTIADAAIVAIVDEISLK